MAYLKFLHTTHLIVRWEDKLEYDEKADEGGVGVVEAKGMGENEELSPLYQEAEQEQAQEDIHLQVQYKWAKIRIGLYKIPL